MLGCLSQLAVAATAFLAGRGYISAWWIALPVFLTASFAISNGPMFGQVLQANRDGRTSVFPLVLAANMFGWALFAGAIFWVTRIFS